MRKRDRMYKAIEHENKQRRSSKDTQLHNLLDEGNVSLEETVAVITNKGMEMFTDFLMIAIEQKIGDILSDKLSSMITEDSMARIMEDCMVKTVSGFMQGLNQTVMGREVGCDNQPLLESSTKFSTRQPLEEENILLKKKTQI